VPETARPAGPSATVRRWLVAFGRFWWDFLIGDTPGLTLGAVLAVAAAAALALDHSARWPAVVALPLVVVLALAASARQGARR
jgi:hypothetical protein